MTQTTTLLAYHNDPVLKQRFLEELQKHKAADAFVRGTYGDGKSIQFRGCAVGCSIHSLNIIQGKSYETGYHLVYEEAIGVHVQLAWLEDSSFENIGVGKMEEWPIRFAQAIPVGADLTLVTPKLMIWLMEHHEQYSQNSPEVINSLREVSNLYQRVIAGKTVKSSEWKVAAEKARTANAAAADAAADYPVTDSYAANAAARTANAAALATYEAAKAATYDVDKADAYEAAKAATWDLIANKLIELLEEAV